MRSACILFAFLLVCSGHGQDLIVTTTGDSIRCIINTVAPARLFYMTKDGTGNKRSDIALEQVAMYKRDGFFPVIMSEVRARALDNASMDERKRWLMSFSGGYSRRTASYGDQVLSSPEKEYMDRLRNGLHASASLLRYVNEEVAVGAEYNSFFASRSSTTVKVLTSANDTVTGEMADDIRLRYVGLDVLYRPASVGKLSFYGSLGIGYLKYIDRATFINDFTITGETVAYCAHLGLDLRVTSGISIGARAGFFRASLNRFEVDLGSTSVAFTLPNYQEESVNRVDAGLVLRIHL